MAAPTEPHIEIVKVCPITPGPAEIAVRELLRHVSEDPNRDGLWETPLRVTKFLREATVGYDVDVRALLKTFDNDASYDQMVSVGPIPFYSLCEHHMVPFFGNAWVAYVPDGRIVGLSKLARLVDAFAKRLQVQERMTAEIADALWLPRPDKNAVAGTQEGLFPQGVGVMVQARHMCMEMRGVEKSGSFTRTTALRGCFHRNAATREEWLAGCR